MKRLTFLIISILIFLFVSVSFAQKAMRVKGKSQAELPGVVYRTGWALLIGINKYPNLPAQNQLNYAVADAEALSRLLKKKFGFNESNIKLLRDEAATKKGILDALGDLADENKVNKNDGVLIFYSGHAQTVPLPKSGGDMGFLVPYDAKVELSDKPNFSQYYKSCIGMDELKRVSRGIPAKHIIFIVDACYSGLAIETSRGLEPDIPGYLKKVARADVEQMITAGGKGEVSVEKSNLGHGVFTYKLLEGLEKEIADWNDDGVITGTELGTYLRNVVPQMSKQTPDFRREGEGEFLFLPQVEEEAEEQMIVEELESTATLFVDSNPTGASVYVEGKLKGTTPCTIEVDAGIEGKREVTVALSKEGYRTKRAKVKLMAGKKAKWANVRLDKLPKQTPEQSQSIDQSDDTRVDEVPDFGATKYRPKDGMKMVYIAAVMMGSDDKDLMNAITRLNAIIRVGEQHNALTKAKEAQLVKRIQTAFHIGTPLRIDTNNTTLSPDEKALTERINAWADAWQDGVGKNETELEDALDYYLSFYADDMRLRRWTRFNEKWVSSGDLTKAMFRRRMRRLWKKDNNIRVNVVPFGKDYLVIKSVEDTYRREVAYGVKIQYWRNIDGNWVITHETWTPKL